MRQESDPVFFHSLKTHIWCEDKILRSKQMKKKNLNLNKARTVKNDEFYTLYEDIEREIFYNSVGYASKQEGGNLIVKEQWLEDPSWTVYVMISNEESEKLADHMIHRRCVYIPYLGKNDHPADIHDISYVEISENKELGCMINSLSPYNGINFDMSEATFKYEEFLPIRLDSELNQHELQKFILTDAIAEDSKVTVYKAEDKNIVFY